MNPNKKYSSAGTQMPGIVTSLNNIYKKVNEEGFGEETAIALESDIKTVSDRFGISSSASVLLAAILENNGRSGCDEYDLAEYIGCTNIEFIGFHEALEELEERDVVTRRTRGDNYSVCREALRSIEKDTDFVPLRRTGLSAEELFTRFRFVYADFHRGLIDCDRLLYSLLGLIKDNPQLSFCMKVSEALSNPVFSDSEKRFFLTLCHQYVSHGKKSVSLDKLLQFIDLVEDDQRIRCSLSAGRSDIQRSGLVTFGGEEGFQDANSLALSDEVKRTFFTEVTPAKEPVMNCRDLVPSSTIKPKELFFDGKVAEQMERLAELLDPGHFSDVQERLKEMGMRKGFAILFSGAAGCGKTAGVYELARRTGRDVYLVDMSSLKSKWVGDSEKIVKGVFLKYREMCRTRDLAPILLFNEADAVFSKRLQNPQDSADQMMNAIQNICLDAIENLDGILIATTNLASNFCDEAFARRFIFKVEFNRPELGTRAKIWRSMLSGLSEEDSLTLAARYDFSGGNIENIARKAAVGYVLSGRKAGLKELCLYSDEEVLSSMKYFRRIGF